MLVDMSTRAGIKRIVMLGALVLGIAVVSLIAWGEVTSRLTSDRIRNRTAYWTSAVGQGVPIGEPRDQAERWLRRTPQVRDADVYDPDRHALVASIETVQVIGAKFPCAAWVILVEIQLGPDDRVTSRKVRNSGICV